MKRWLTLWKPTEVIFSFNFGNQIFDKHIGSQKPDIYYYRSQSGRDGDWVRPIPFHPVYEVRAWFCYWGLLWFICLFSFLIIIFHNLCAKSYRPGLKGQPSLHCKWLGWLWLAGFIHFMPEPAFLVLDWFGTILTRYRPLSVHFQRCTSGISQSSWLESLPALVGYNSFRVKHMLY